MRRGRALGFYVSVGLTSIASLALVNIAADRLPIKGLAELRDYLIRRNG